MQISNRIVKRIDKKELMREVSLCRIVFSLILVLIVLNYKQIEYYMQYTYKKYLTTSFLFNHDSFEPILASSVFALNIGLWNFIDYRLPFLHKYRIQDSDSLDAWSNRYRALRDEVLWYLGPLFLIDSIYKRRRIPLEPPR